MTDDEIVDGYVKHVDRIPTFPPPKSVEAVKAAINAIDAVIKADDDNFWAWEAVTDLINSDPERAWRVILASLAQCAPDHEYIIGAGPLEDLLVKYPRRFAQRVVDELRSSDRFRRAFDVVMFSTEYTTVEDAEYFNETLASAVATEFVPTWRIAEPYEDD